MTDKEIDDFLLYYLHAGPFTEIKHWPRDPTRAEATAGYQRLWEAGLIEEASRGEWTWRRTRKGLRRMKAMVPPDRPPATPPTPEPPRELCLGEVATLAFDGGFASQLHDLCLRAVAAINRFAKFEAVTIGDVRIARLSREIVIRPRCPRNYVDLAMVAEGFRFSRPLPGEPECVRLRSAFDPKWRPFNPRTH